MWSQRTIASERPKQRPYPVLRVRDPVTNFRVLSEILTFSEPAKLGYLNLLLSVEKGPELAQNYVSNCSYGVFMLVRLSPFVTNETRDMESVSLDRGTLICQVLVLTMFFRPTRPDPVPSTSGHKGGQIAPKPLFLRIFYASYNGSHSSRHAF